MLQLFTAPSTTAVESGVGTWSIWIFGALLILSLLIAGLAIGGMIAAKISSSVVRAVGKVAGRRRGGRGRRR